jgi:hypothetical protein
MMRRTISLSRWGVLAASLALSALLMGAVLERPASAGNLPGCCLCQGCVTPPATQCFENPALGCENQCAALNCAGFSNTAISCGQQTICPTFTAPAPAPALAPVGLTLAALVLTGLGLRAMRHRR